MKRFSRIIFVALLFSLTLSGCQLDSAKSFSPDNGARAAVLSSGQFNYGEALQKAIWFYDEQRCGHVAGEENRVNWRGDCHLQDGSDNGVDLTGGWHDAGDHIKFALPMSYSAGMLMWGIYENKQAYIDMGQYDEMLDNIKWATDYLIKCHTAPNEYWYQVSNKSFDHNWWGPAEVFPTDRERPSYKLTMSNPGSTATADVAATLAMASIIFADVDPAYAAECLSHAEQLYDFANTARSDAGYTAANGMYNTWSGFWDELQWASVWLYLATDDNSYLQAAEDFTANLNHQGQTSDIEYQWAHCWDDKHYGAMLLLARITGKSEYHDFVQKHLDWWAVNGAKGWTPGGLAWASMWGSLRYASTAAFLAFVYADVTDDASLQERYRNFGISQIDYILGDNPQNFSYMIGFGNDYPQRPHHRLAHSSYTDQMTNPSYHRHTLFGALVGGPESASDSDYNDEINDYESNEVATDYNAGLTSSLGYMVSFFGGSPLANFPSPEEPSNIEFYNMATINNSSSSYTELKILTHNHSGWPARFAENVSYRYFFDISEMIDAGASIDDVSIQTNYVEFDVSTEIKHLAGTVYYVEVTFLNDTDLFPGGQSPHAGEVQLRISVPASATYWDPTNDFSYIGLGSGNAGLAVTDRIPVYENGQLVYGLTPIEDNDPPASPAGLTSSGVSQTEISLDWSNNSEADLAGYRVYRSATSNMAQAVLIDTVSASNYVDDGLSAGTTYYYAVTALDSSGNESPRSSAISATTEDPDTVPPAAPAGLTASAAGETAVNLQWTANGESDLAGYKVYRDTSPVTSAASGLFVGNSATAAYADNGLTAGTTYYYAVTAVDTSGNESAVSSSAEVTTDAEDTTPPAIPSGLTVGEITASSVSVSWTPATEADFDHYAVYIGSSASFTKSNGTLIGTTANAMRVIGSLNPETTYYVKVCAVDGSGNESYLSSAVSATTDSAPAASLGLNWIPSQTSSSTNTIGGKFVITNSGSDDIDLNGVALNYYLTKDKNVDLAFWCDHAGGMVKGSYTSFTSSVNGSFAAASGTDTDTVVTVGFGTSAPVLGPGDSVDVQVRITRVDWSNFNQSNDYSFNNANGITAYYLGALVTGIEP